MLKYFTINIIQIFSLKLLSLIGAEVEALTRARLKNSQLTAYFELCTHEISHPLILENRGRDTNGAAYPEAKDLTYREIPEFYTWDTNKTCWIRRKRPHKSDMIGRIYTVHPKEGERFYLRLLLIHTKGILSFQSLKTIDNIVHLTFKHACKAYGLLADDNEWITTLKEGAAIMGANSLRLLFVHILFHNEPSNPLELWNIVLDENFHRSLKTDMAEDFRVTRCVLQGNRHAEIDQTDIDQCIYDLDDKMRDISNGMSDFIERYDIHPVQQRMLPVDPLMAAINEETFDREEQRII